MFCKFVFCFIYFKNHNSIAISLANFVFFFFFYLPINFLSDVKPSLLLSSTSNINNNHNLHKYHHHHHNNDWSTNQLSVYEYPNNNNNSNTNPLLANNIDGIGSCGSGGAGSNSGGGVGGGCGGGRLLNSALKTRGSTISLMTNHRSSYIGEEEHYHLQQHYFATTGRKDTIISIGKNFQIQFKSPSTHCLSWRYRTGLEKFLIFLLFASIIILLAYIYIPYLYGNCKCLFVCVCVCYFSGFFFLLNIFLYFLHLYS